MSDSGAKHGAAGDGSDGSGSKIDGSGVGSGSGIGLGSGRESGTDMSTSDESAGDVAGRRLRRRRVQEIWLLLGVSLGQSAVYAVISLVAKLTAGPPLAQQTATLNASVRPRAWLDLTYQVADTDLKTSAFRKIVLAHAMLSYIFGTAIIATTINFLVNLSK